MRRTHHIRIPWFTGEITLDLSGLALPKIPGTTTLDLHLGDIAEELWLRRSDEAWDEDRIGRLAAASGEGPIVTGNPMIDAWEAERWERLSAGGNG